MMIELISLLFTKESQSLVDCWIEGQKKLTQTCPWCVGATYSSPVQILSGSGDTQLSMGPWSAGSVGLSWARHCRALPVQGCQGVASVVKQMDCVCFVLKGRMILGKNSWWHSKSFLLWNILGWIFLCFLIK